jgi:hypothetical protein
VIIGTYPCCNGNLWHSMPDRSPAYLPEDCPHCGARVWHRFSRVQSTSWTEADFLAEHDVDIETRMITPKPGTEAARFDQMCADLNKAVGEGKIDLSQALMLAAVQGAIEDVASVMKTAERP